MTPVLKEIAANPTINMKEVPLLPKFLDYSAIGRKLLMVDELPQGALPRYERDVACIAYIVGRNYSVSLHLETTHKFIDLPDP